MVERTAGPGLQRFLEVPLRRPRLVAVPFVIALVASLVAPLAVEKRYRSSTLILVEKEKVPESFVPKIRGEDAAPRLLTIKQEILSRTRLERVIDELNPYPERLHRAPLSELVTPVDRSLNFVALLAGLVIGLTGAFLLAERRAAGALAAARRGATGAGEHHR